MYRHIKIHQLLFTTFNILILPTAACIQFFRFFLPPFIHSTCLALFLFDSFFCKFQKSSRYRFLSNKFYFIPFFSSFFLPSSCSCKLFSLSLTQILMLKMKQRKKRKNQFFFQLHEYKNC